MIEAVFTVCVFAMESLDSIWSRGQIFDWLIDPNSAQSNWHIDKQAWTAS